MSNDDPFQESKVSSLDEFQLTYLNILKNRQFFHTFYRGQSEAIWGLVPSAFRSLTENEIPIDSVKHAIAEEFSKVASFIRIADRIGFDLPGELWEFLNKRFQTFNATSLLITSSGFS